MPFARHGEHKLHYEVTGSGPMLVMHPGMYEVGSAWTLKGYTPALRDQFTVVEVDPLAHGASDAPHDPAAYTLERRVGDVLAVLDDLGADEAAYWGYSMGAWIGCGMAKFAPQRCTALVLGAWDPIGGIETAYDDAVQRLGMSADSDWVEVVRQMAYAAPEQVPVVDAGDPQAFRLSHHGFEGQAGLDAALASAGVPLLMYCGSADPYHDNIRAVAERAGGQFTSIPDADHGTTTWRTLEILAYALPFLTAAAR